MTNCEKLYIPATCEKKVVRRKIDSYNVSYGYMEKTKQK